VYKHTHLGPETELDAKYEFIAPAIHEAAKWIAIKIKENSLICIPVMRMRKNENIRRYGKIDRN